MSAPHIVQTLQKLSHKNVRLNFHSHENVRFAIVNYLHDYKNVRFLYMNFSYLFYFMCYSSRMLNYSSRMLVMHFEIMFYSLRILNSYLIMLKYSSNNANYVNLIIYDNIILYNSYHQS